MRWKVGDFNVWPPDGRTAWVIAVPEFGTHPNFTAHCGDGSIGDVQFDTLEAAVAYVLTEISNGTS